MPYKSQPPTFKVQKCTFVTDKAATAPANGGQESTFLVGPTPVPQRARPYRRIAFVESHSPEPELSDVRSQQQQRRNSPLAPMPPVKRRKVDPKSAKDTRLTVKRPVQVADKVHEDAWRLIFRFSEPKFLLRMRHAAPLFYHVLKESSIWRSSRENKLNDKIPPCPSHLTEQQYVDLLVGMGCQNHLCLKRETKKPYWMFGCRLCEDCLREKTSTDLHATAPSPQEFFAELFTDESERQQYGTSLVDLIPSAVTDGGRYSHARPVDPVTGKWFAQERQPQGFMYMKRAYNRILDEFSQIREERWDAHRVLEWTKEKYESATKLAQFADRFPTFNGNGRLRLEHTNWRDPIRMQRDQFFRKKAMELPEPLTKEQLDTIAAYQAALQTPNIPTDRAWNTLLPKMLPYRQEAKRIVGYQKTFARCNSGTTVNDWPEEARVFRKLHDHRCIQRIDSGHAQHEQLIVLALAREELKRAIDVVADEDLVLVCLRNTFDAYQRLPLKPSGLNCDGQFGEYILMLDDARMIVEEVIRPEVIRHLFERNTLRYSRIFEGFKCPGCTRYQSNRKWSFKGGFEHILQKHATLVGEDLYFSRFAKNFVRPAARPPSSVAGVEVPGFTPSNIPWYLVEWTPTLPLLPSHATVTVSTRWIPFSTEPYQQLATGQRGSAFTGRSVVAPSHHEAGSAESPPLFQEALAHAVRSLASTRLETTAILKIGLKYAASLSPVTSTVPEFVDCCKDLERCHPWLKMRLKCGVCVVRDDLLKRAKFAKSAVDLSTLAEHWTEKHSQDEVEWMDCFLHLPTDHELLDILVGHDEQLAQEQAKSMQRETEGIRKTIRKAPDPKAGALMRKSLAMDVLDRLFPLHSTSSVLAARR